MLPAAAVTGTLMLSNPGKIIQQTTFWNIFLFLFLANRIWHFMQIVSTGDNLPEVSDPIF